MTPVPAESWSGEDLTGDRAFYNSLLKDSRIVVPVVGSGLTVNAGAPGFLALNKHLIEAAMTADGFSDQLPEDGSFVVADRLAATFGEAWVQERAASLFRSSPLTPTASLLALARVKSGIIVTTNYDLALEQAATEINRPYRTLTLNEFDEVVKADASELLVLHLHGVADDPEGIVLTEESYTRMLNDERSRLLLRDLGIRHRFVFLGHGLSDHEVHIRRELRWVFDSARSVAARPHLLVTDVRSVTDPESLSFKTKLEAAAGLQVVMFPDPERKFEAAIRAAHVIAGPSSVEHEDTASVLSDEEFDLHYLALPMAEADKVSTADGRGAYMWHVWHDGELASTDLDEAEDRMILEAGGGAGKSQELRQIARRSERPALLQSLKSFQVSEGWDDPATKFVSGMTSARAGRPGVPRLTLDRLRDESYVFLLDELDEVSSTNRAQVLGLVEAVANQYPQHRYVLASRPLPELRTLGEFRRWVPVTGAAWLSRYSKNRGVDPEALQAALPENGDLGDLVVVPVFAAAVVGRVFANEPIETSALALVCGLADGRAKDTRIELDAATLRSWLDRLALAMQLSGENQVTILELRESGLHAGLEGLAPTEQMLSHLATRALLSDDAGTVRFPANIIKEARAARAVLDAGDEGLALIKQEALVQLATRDLAGETVRTVHASWVNLLELLLPLAPVEWRNAVAEFDATLVARSTASGAEAADRDRAVRLLWETYLKRGIWLERGSGEGNGSGDADALIRLLRAGIPDGFADVVQAALSDAERTTRGNAIELLPYLQLPLAEVLRYLTIAVKDEDPVVRRRAAAAVWALQPVVDLSTEPELLDGFVNTLVEQAADDQDETAVETLISVAIDLAPAERAAKIALQAPVRVRRRAVAELVRRYDRGSVLDLLRADGPFETELFDELVASRGFADRSAWTAEEVGTLAHVIADHPEETRSQSDAQEILREHPGRAILAWARHPLTVDHQIELNRLIAHLDIQELAEVAELIDKNSGPHDADGEVRHPDPETVELIRSLLQHRLERGREAPDAGASQRPAQSSLPVGAEEPSSADDDDRQVRSLFDDGFVAEMAGTKMYRPRTIAGLQRGAVRGVPLAAGDCLELFKLLLDFFDSGLEDWMRANWSSEVAELVHAYLPELSGGQMLRAADILPPPWDASLGVRILEAAHLTEDQLGLRLRAADRVAQHAGEDVLVTWSADTSARWTDPLLVRIGDCEAEARMLASLQENPERISRYPSAREEEWISSLRCPSSTEHLISLLRVAWAADVAHSNLDSLQRALNRCAGDRAPVIWEELANDTSIRSSRFLYYQRRSAINELVERQAGVRRMGDPGVRDLVVGLVKGPHSSVR